MLKELFRHPVLLLKSVASVMYFIMGLIILAGRILEEDLGKTFSIALGVLLVVYGAYRFYRIIGEWRELTENTEE